MSTISGTGVASSITAFTTYTLTVTAKDSSGNNIGHGGDTFLVDITNKCTLGSYNICSFVAGSKQTLSSPISGTFTDNGDGTYTYNYSVSLDGAITIIVKLIESTGVNCKWYQNTYWGGIPYHTNNFSYINFWAPSSNSLVPGIGDNFTGILSTKLYAPTTDTYTFSMYSDDGSKFIINGVTIFNSLSSGCICYNIFTAYFTANSYNDIQILYHQVDGPLQLNLYWSSSTISQQVIPASYFFLLSIVSSSPLQITTNCPNYYSGSNPSYPTICKEICGDGVKIGSEKCDDGNTANGDGCSSTCTIEAGFACSGGSIYAKDTCVYCTSGLYTNTDQSQCIPHCGDGFRAGSEKCDDGNTSSGDGCLNDCSSVEAGFICTGGSPTSKDTCIKCDKGFYQNNASNPTQCVPKCGDGLRVSYEHCDDANTISGDGCSSDCMKIEAGCVCFGGNFGVTDVCVLCDLGYDPNPDYSKCIGATVPRDVNAMASACEIGAYTGVSSDLALTAFSPSSSTSSNSFGMVNQIQLAILLPLIGTYIPEKIYDYLKSMNSNLFHLNSLPTSNFGSTINVKSQFDFEQPNSYLSLLQLNSGSALVNIFSLTTTVCLVICIHIMLLTLFAVLFKFKKLPKLQNLILKLAGILTFGFYIKVYLEAFVLFLLVDISEIQYQNKNGVQNVNSTVASYCIGAVVLSFMFLALWQWWKSRKPEVLETMKYFVILFQGMKTTWICRSYWLVFLVRRTVFICIIFFVENNQITVKVALFMSMQVVYFAYILILRPHVSIKDNLSDFINEIFYLYYVVFLMYFNTESRWNDTITEAYFWILMSNNFILMFIILLEPYITGTSSQLVEEQKEEFSGSISKDNLKNKQTDDKMIYEDKDISIIQRIDRKINSSNLVLEDINE